MLKLWECVTRKRPDSTTCKLWYNKIFVLTPLLLIATRSMSHLRLHLVGNFCCHMVLVCFGVAWQDYTIISCVLELNCLLFTVLMLEKDWGWEWGWLMWFVTSTGLFGISEHHCLSLIELISNWTCKTVSHKWIPRHTQSMASCKTLTECFWEFQSKNALWATK